MCRNFEPLAPAQVWGIMVGGKLEFTVQGAIGFPSMSLRFHAPIIAALLCAIRFAIHCFGLAIKRLLRGRVLSMERVNLLGGQFIGRIVHKKSPLGIRFHVPTRNGYQKYTKQNNFVNII